MLYLLFPLMMDEDCFWDFTQKNNAVIAFELFCFSFLLPHLVSDVACVA